MKNKITFSPPSFLMCEILLQFHSISFLSGTIVQTVYLQELLSDHIIDTDPLNLESVGILSKYSNSIATTVKIPPIRFVITEVEVIAKD